MMEDALPRPRMLYQQFEEQGGICRPAYPGDCGHDLIISEKLWIGPGDFVDISCGVQVALPPSTWGLIIGRSSTFRRKFLHVVPGVIDAGYRGPLAVGCWNAGPEPVEVEPGERLAQFIVIRVVTPILERSDALPPSKRGTKAFGSTGD